MGTEGLESSSGGSKVTSIQHTRPLPTTKTVNTMFINKDDTVYINIQLIL